ncbi:MAG: hypothetical protein RLY31_1734 [Bacteroidota bacterium]
MPTKSSYLPLPYHSSGNPTAPPAGLPLFHQPWWLDATCGSGRWQGWYLPHADGSLAAAIAWMEKSAPWGRTVRMPPFTPYLGIYLAPEMGCAGKRTTRYHRENQLVDALADTLPGCLWYHQIHTDSLLNWLPFQRRGYRQSTRYTYLLSPQSAAQRWDDLEPSVRNKIRKAEKSGITVARTGHPDVLRSLCRDTFRRQGLASPFDRPHWSALHAAVQARGQGDIYVASLPDDRPVAALYRIWDDRTAFCWMLATDTAQRHTGAASLSLWHAIRDTMAEGKVFNFEGSMLPTVEPFFRSFGAERTPVHQIFKPANRWIHALHVLLRD